MFHIHTHTHTHTHIHTYIYIYIYNIVVSVTLGFMHFAFVGQTLFDECKKNKSDTTNWNIIFLLHIFLFVPNKLHCQKKKEKKKKFCWKRGFFKEIFKYLKGKFSNWQEKWWSCDPSSNPGRCCFFLFHIALISMKKLWIPLSSL